jgi:hypothetical protein
VKFTNRGAQPDNGVAVKLTAGLCATAKNVVAHKNSVVIHRLTDIVCIFMGADFTVYKKFNID